MYFVSLNSPRLMRLTALTSLQDLGKIQILGLSNLVFSRPETKCWLLSTPGLLQECRPVDWNIIINDGILVTRGIHPQHYSLLLLKWNHCYFWLLQISAELTEQAYSVSSTSFQQSDLTFSGSPRPSYSHSFFMGLDLTSILSMEIGFSYREVLC